MLATTSSKYSVSKYLQVFQPYKTLKKERNHQSGCACTETLSENSEFYNNDPIRISLVVGNNMANCKAWHKAE